MGLGKLERLERKMLTCDEIWDLAAAMIAPTQPTRPGFADGLHPKMRAALDKLGWNARVEVECEERRVALEGWEATGTWVPTHTEIGKGKVEVKTFPKGLTYPER